MRRHKYIFVFGGVMSGVGKGITTASIARILHARGFKVNPIKIDPYLNVDAGTMNPGEHGEVFVLASGLECDQDMGNYERFLDIKLGSENYMTTGMVYRSVIERERNLEYGGKCVEAVPHIPQEVLRRINESARKTRSDITLVEIGGTVGEYQNILFIEAARLLRLKNPGDVIFVLVSYLPVPHNLGEMKTKPTQYAIRTLNSYGVHPDIVVGRSEKPLDEKRRTKIADSAGMPSERIISAPDVRSIYEVPILFEKEQLSSTILKLFNLRPTRKSDLKLWKAMIDKSHHAKELLRIAMIGKYFKTGDFVLSDVYISIIESLKHAALNLGVRLELDWIDSTAYETKKEKVKELEKYDGVLVPGGFGGRGILGKIFSIQYAREHKIPYLGLCYGMQLAVVEYARHVLGWQDAHTTEIDPGTSHPVVDVMSEQISHLREKDYGGSMRLGVYPAKIRPGTLARRAYDKEIVEERHRHRYEINPKYLMDLTEAGLIFSGMSPDGVLAEIIELPEKIHPFFLATQFHPEFQSSPLNPHPLFMAFMKAAVKKGASKK